MYVCTYVLIKHVIEILHVQFCRLTDLQGSLPNNSVGLLAVGMLTLLEEINICNVTHICMHVYIFI